MGFYGSTVLLTRWWNFVQIMGIRSLVASAILPNMMHYHLDPNIHQLQSNKSFLFLYAPVTALAISAVIAMALRFEELTPRLRLPKTVAAVSRMGYSLHLTHPISIFLFYLTLQFRSLSLLEFIGLCLVNILLSLPLALALFIFVEKPFSDLAKLKAR